MDNLNSEIEKFLKDRGALSVGFTTQERLENGPPSCDFSYILPGAKYAVSFTLPLNTKYGHEFIKKESYWKFVLDNVDVNRDAVLYSEQLAEWLRSKGYKANIAPPPGQYIKWARANNLKSKFRDKIYKYMLKNINKKWVKKYLIKIFRENKMKSFLSSDSQYRMERKDWRMILPPYISHRYIAVRSGAAYMLWSGNVGLKEYGSNIILGTVLTDAELEPTEPLPEEDNFCGGYKGTCQLCLKSCPTRMWSNDEMEEVNLGGYTVRYAKRVENMRCQIACGGLSGLDETKKWSSWSPGRYDTPEDQDEMIVTLIKAFLNQKFWPKNPDPVFNLPIIMSCAMCQLICVGNHKETSQRYIDLIKSGCVIQNQEGKYDVFSQKEAEEVFKSFPKEHQDKYR